jgi:hypothetical protein
LESLIEKTGRKNASRKSNCSNQLDRIHTVKRERTDQNSSENQSLQVLPQTKLNF